MDNNTMMKDWMEMWEGNMTKMMDEVVKSQHFMKNLLTTYEPMMDMQKNLNSSREKFFDTFGVASKKDVQNVAAKLQDIEIKIADILENLEQKEERDEEIIKALHSLTAKVTEKPVAKTAEKKPAKAKTAKKGK